MVICILGSIFLLLIVALIVIVKNGGRYEEPEDVPGCDYDYGEPPYNSYKYN